MACWLRLDGSCPGWYFVGLPNRHPAIARILNMNHPNGVSPNDLLLLLSREMPFGKFQGRLIADLPGHYLNWFAREGFPPGEIGRLLALMHEIDHNGLKGILDPLRRRDGVRPLGTMTAAGQERKLNSKP
jgi:uncharacterized protein